MWMTSKSLAHHLVQAIASSVFFSFLSSTFLRLSNAYLESCQKSKIKRFVKILIGWNLLTLFAKSSILDAWQGCEYASGYQNIALFFFLTPRFSSRFTSHVASPLWIAERSTIASQKSALFLLSTTMWNLFQVSSLLLIVFVQYFVDLRHRWLHTVVQKSSYCSNIFSYSSSFLVHSFL